MCLLESGCWKPRLSTGLSPTLLPVRCVIALPAALLANSNPFIFPPVLEFWLSEGHKFRTGLLFCKHGRGGPPPRCVRLASSSAAADEDRWDAAPRANSSGQRKQAIISRFGVYDRLVLATGRLEASPHARARAFASPPAGVFDYFPPFTSDHKLNSTIRNPRVVLGCLELALAARLKKRFRETSTLQIT